MLYELLDRHARRSTAKQLQSAALTEMLRLIREEEPPAPEHPADAVRRRAAERGGQAAARSRRG